MVELSQFAKSAMKSSRPNRSILQCAVLLASSSPRFFTNACHLFQASFEQCSFKCLSEVTLAAKSPINRNASWRNFGGQFGSAGSGHKAAQRTARHAASGRRAHQICSVEM